MRGTGREYGRTYLRVKRKEVHDFVEAGISRSGGSVLFASGPDEAPHFFVVEDSTGAVWGLVIYAFPIYQRDTPNRPKDENRGQIRYGDVNSREWREQDHAVAFDPAGLDVTMILGCQIEKGLFVGFPPSYYDPLPIGDSIYAKDGELERATRQSWAVFERENRGRRRQGLDTSRLETVVAFTPERLLDYVALEREAQTLGFDSALRFVAATRAAVPKSRGLHDLEQAYDLSAHEVLDVIRGNRRLGMAVRGGVAERHLELALRADPAVREVKPGAVEGPPDFQVSFLDGSVVAVECKNASPQAFSDGTYKVEIQKTRASKNDPLSRFYTDDAFDVVAACLYGPTSEWTFRFCPTVLLDRQQTARNRIKPVQRIDARWKSSLEEALRSADRG